MPKINPIHPSASYLPPNGHCCTTINTPSHLTVPLHRCKLSPNVTKTNTAAKQNACNPNRNTKTLDGNGPRNFALVREREGFRRLNHLRIGLQKESRPSNSNSRRKPEADASAINEIPQEWIHERERHANL